MLYLARYRALLSSTKPINFIIITNGVLSNDVKLSIVKVAKELNILKAPL